MVKRRSFGRALAGAAVAAIAVLATPASPQQVTRIVAFGDSYADDGNLWQLLGSNPYANTIYSTGRFTGGTNYIDTLGTTYGVTPENFAIGGALTDNRNTNSPLLPGFAYEWTSYLAGGGGIFPTGPGTFSSGDLVTFSIGGNDARFYQQNGGTVAGASAAAATSVAAATAGMNQLVAAGAPTISFLAGNTALLPEVQTYPDPAGAQAVRNAYSTAFNSGMQSVLAGYAANGTIVHYLDLTTMIGQVQANPSAYGFTNLGACSPIPTCVADSNYANQYVFWVDLLHPTSHTSAIIAEYIAAQLEAPFTLSAPSDLGLEVAQQFGRTLTTRMDLTAPRDGGKVDGLRFYLTGDGLSRDVGPSVSTDRFAIRGVGLTAGAEYGFGTGVVGIAANYSKPKADFTTAGETDDHSWQLGGYGAMSWDGTFAQAYLGYGHDNHRIERTGVVEGMRASPSGNHWIAGAKGGYLFPLDVVRLGPVVGLDYAKAKVDGYTETGDPTLTLNVSSASAKALEGSIGLELRGNLSAGGAPVRPFASALLVKDFEGDGRWISFAQTSAPTIVNSWQIQDQSKQVFGRLSGGLSASLFNGVDVDALIAHSVGRKYGEDTSVHLGVVVGL